MGLEFTEQYRTWSDVTIAEDQIEGINFLLNRTGGILAYGTGTGKTLTGLVAMKILLDKYDTTKCVVVCPVKALKAFKREIFNRMGYSRDLVGILATNEMDFDVIRNRVFLITDTNIDKYKDLLAEVVARGNKILLMVDEAHKLQDKESKFYQTMEDVKSICTVCWGLTATPILNDLDSLYHIVNFFVPGFLGKKTAFENRYTIWHLRDQYMKGGRKMKVKELDGYKNLDELNTRLKEVMIVHQKDYNLKFGNISRELTDSEMEIYEKVSSGILLGDDSAQRDFTKRLHDLQRFIDRSFDGDEEMKELIKRYQKTPFSTKENMFLETVKSTLDRGYSTIVYADYHTTIDRLEHVLLKNKAELGLNNVFKVTGNIDIKARERVEEEIGDRDIVLITSAGSESVNLQRANCILFYDIPFSTKTIIQVVGRVCRRDTKHKFQYIITLYTKGTVDEYKYLTFQSNLGMIQKSVGAGSDLPLDTMEVDKNNLKKLKDQLLWHYKNSGKKMHRKNKRVLKDSISTSILVEASAKMAKSKFLIEPISQSFSDVVAVSALYPDVALYEKYLKAQIPFTVLRSHYLDFLRSERGRKLVGEIHRNLFSSGGGLLLVGNTELPKVLMEEIIEQYRE